MAEMPSAAPASIDNATQSSWHPSYMFVDVRQDICIVLQYRG
jgi:hypothetical protein